MKVNVKEVKLDDIYLSRIVAKRVSKILMPRYEYLVDNCPEASFSIHEDGMELLSIDFYNDAVGDILTVRDKSMWVDFHTGEKVIIAQYNSFRDIVHLKTCDLYNLPDELQVYVDAESNKYRRFLD